MTGADLLAGWPWFAMLALMIPLGVGHACLWTAILNHLYGLPIPKWFLRSYRLFCGIVIAGFPALYLFFLFGPLYNSLAAYLTVCGIYGFLIFPLITVVRYLTRPPAVVVESRTETVDYWPVLGTRAIGDGKWRWMPRLPFTCVFKADDTRLTLALPKLPAAWTGVRIRLISDLHFHGTPSREWFEAVVARWKDGPAPDLLILAGDIVDTNEHRSWIVPLLGDWPATVGKCAILGNHDDHHEPEKVREELERAGFTVLGNSWELVSIRGVPCVLIGHEGPWFPGAADLRQAPQEAFRLLISHTPDNLPWAKANGVDLMFSGHVHGGQIRLPIISSIFVPSTFGRRYDEGVFHEDKTVLVVNRGVSGKEPIRFRCHPQSIEITLIPANRDG